MSNLFNRNVIQVRPKSYKYWGVYGFHVYNKNIIDKFLKLEIPKGKKCYSCSVSLIGVLNQKI